MTGCKVHGISREPTRCGRPCPRVDLFPQWMKGLDIAQLADGEELTGGGTVSAPAPKPPSLARRSVARSIGACRPIARSS